MLILVFGGTGLIGQAFCAHAMMNGHKPVIVSRNPDKYDLPIKMLGYADAAKAAVQRTLTVDYAAVNLCGADIASKRWTPVQKQYLERSRIDILDRIELFLQQAPQEPAVFLQASATGYYGNHSNEIVDENTPPGNTFLAELAQKWENRFNAVALEDTRKNIIRTGVVLSNKGGMLPKMIKPFKNFAGGPPGSGKQYLSWIHIQDQVRAMLHLIEDKYAYGVFNLTAPNPVTMKEFSSQLGKTMNRPSFMRVPGFLLRMLYGQMAQETILEGAKVIPAKLIDHEFEFIFTDINLALQNLLVKQKGKR